MPKSVGDYISIMHPWGSRRRSFSENLSTADNIMIFAAWCSLILLLLLLYAVLLCVYNASTTYTRSIQYYVGV